MGHSPKCVLVWGPRRDARPAGERRSGGALEGCLSHRDSDPTWSKARDDAHEYKERPGGEAYRPSPSGDSAAPKAITNYPPPGRRANYAFAKDSAPPTGNKNLDLKSLLPAFSHRKVPSPGGVQIKTLYKILRRRQATTNRPPRQRCSPSFAQGSTPPKATAILPQIKFFSPLFFIEK